MINFSVDRNLCISCGLCSKDCPSRIISMVEGFPLIPPEKEESCYRCQHCLAVCPVSAVSILGITPDRVMPLDNLPTAIQMETLIRGRRSVRYYRDENLPSELLDKLLDVAWQAPTGVNSRDVLFTVIDDRSKLSKLRDEVMGQIRSKIEKGELAEQFSWFVSLSRLWFEKRADIIFRNAPHLIIASAPEKGASPLPDTLIALSYFELYAQSCGVGTVWNGLANWGIFDIAEGMKEKLGIPEDHLVGYSMSFGYPDVNYKRCADHGKAKVNRVTL